jgi:hypothetical protein
MTGIRKRATRAGLLRPSPWAMRKLHRARCPAAVRRCEKALAVAPRK